jgi:glutamyl-tRNA reductase
LINVDQLSKIKDHNIYKRQAEIPKAISIIEKHQSDFIEWHQMRKNTPVLKAIKRKIELIHECDIFKSYTSKLYGSPSLKNEEKIQKLVNVLAVKMKSQNQKGCYYLEALNEYIATA